MDFELEIRIPARLDIENAVDWYEQRQPGLGNLFVSDFRSTVAYIKDNPEYFKIYSNGYREVRFKNFPYIIIYKVTDLKIIVIAVFNTHQNPSKRP